MSPARAFRKNPDEFCGDLGDLGSGTQPRAIILGAPEPDREGRCTGIAAGFEPDVGRHIREPEPAAIVDEEAELGRQGLQGPIGDQSRFERSHQGTDIEQRASIAAGQRACDDIARGFGGRIGVEQSEFAHRPDQVREGFLARAAKLQVGTGGEVEVAIAEGARCRGDATRLIERQRAATRLDPDDQPIARRPSD